jgi:hypothetical protein
MEVMIVFPWVADAAEANPAPLRERDESVNPM